ncbi:MAG: hypothetical protein WC343_01925 [Bacilli bacterium]|jgi:hypothetical protein
MLKENGNKLKNRKILWVGIFSLALVAVLGTLYYAHIEYQAEEDKKAQQAFEEQTKESILNDRRDALLKEAENLVKGYFVDEAIELLNKDESLVNDEIQEKIDEYTEYKNSYVLYEEPVQHIFFHSLILYPEYLFKNITVPSGGLNEGFSYKRELERMLPLLLERGYVLYNINDVFVKDENGIMKQKDIYLPAGKKPLILSVDDPAYANAGTDNIGLAHRMILDENGKLATEVVTPAKETIITFDGDVELVVMNFIEEHPEFSYRGARGIIASTGYLGFMGYTYEEILTDEGRSKAKSIADKLKEEGWLFASHSYTHNRLNFFGAGSNASNIAWDTKKWMEIIEPIVGSTNIFIAPFGYKLGGAALDVIINNGFDIYCNVVSQQKIVVYEKYALMGRIEMSGYSYTYYKNYLNKYLFDVDKVMDSYRPPMLSS